MLNFNGPAKERGRLGVSDFVDALGFIMGEEIKRSPWREEWERSVREELGTGHHGEGKRMAEGASLKEMRWRTKRRWRLA
jgi:hypothetical protein